MKYMCKYCTWMILQVLYCSMSILCLNLFIRIETLNPACFLRCSISSAQHGYNEMLKQGKIINDS